MNPEDRVVRAAAAKHLCGIQPPSIQSRLLDDEGFCGRLDLKPEGIITVGDHVPIREGVLLGEVRRVLTSRRDEELSDEQGCRFKVGIGKHGVALKGLSGRSEPWAADLPELLVLSPHRDERLHALRELLAELGPTSLDLSWTIDAAARRDLTDEEVGTLIRERVAGVGALQARAEQALRERRAGLTELVPDALAYYEMFSGPDPKGEAPESYLRDTLPEYRRVLLRRDLVRGLDNCLMGTLRDDLSPGPWMRGASDDDVWAALERCEYADNPFALLGALDTALLRQADDRFLVLAERLTGRLLGDSMLRPNGIDAYELLSLLAGLVANRINTVEGGTLRPPFWKRMCAWMHAGFLLRAMSRYWFDLASFRNWVHKQLTLAGEYASALDLRREPMYSATVMSAGALRQEVLGRLLSLRSRHEAAGRMMPLAGEIEAAIRKLPDDNLHGWWAFPGPLEGHQRPAESEGRAIPDAEAAELAGQLGNDPAGPFFSILAHLAQRFDLTGALLDLARETARRASLAGSVEDRASILGRLSDACVLAAAQRDEGLSSAVAVAALTGALDARSEEEVQRIFRCLLLAGAAFQDEGAWAQWMESQLALLAVRLPRGTPTGAFRACLSEMKSVIDLTLCIHGRAEAFTSAADA